MLKLNSVFAALLVFSVFQIAKADICSRTLIVQKEIKNELQKEQVDCSQITDADLLYVKEIDLGDESNLVLKPGDLDGLFNVNSMDLSGSDMVQIPADIFKDLQKLTTLNLSENKLTTLPAGLFTSLTFLEKLWIDDNNIAQPTPGLFQNLTSLKLIRFDLNAVDLNELKKLTTLNTVSFFYEGNRPLPADLYQGLPELMFIRIAAKDLTNPLVLPPTIFKGLTKISGIVLQDGIFETLDENQFAGLSSLQQLTIVGSKIQSLPETIFQPLANLKELRLRSNMFQSVPKNLLSLNGKIELLQIAGVPAIANALSLLKPLTHLKKLDLSYNGIVNLADDTFTGMPLESVNLQSNKIVEILPLVFDPVNFSPKATVLLMGNPLSAQTKTMLQQELGDRAKF